MPLDPQEKTETKPSKLAGLVAFRSMDRLLIRSFRPVQRDGKVTM